MDTNPYQPPQAEILVSSETSNAEAVRKAHINHEASVKSVGTLFLLGGILMFLAPLSTVGRINELFHDPYMLGTLTGTLAISALYLWVGFGLRKLKRSRRIPATFLSGIGLLAFPVGTVISAYFMYLLLCDKGKVVLSEEYKQIIAHTPHIKYKSVVIWVILGLLLLIIAIGVIAAVMTKPAP